MSREWHGQAAGRPQRVQVVPFTAGRLSALGASTFSLIEFPSARLPTLLYQESVSSTEVVERPALVREYAMALNEAFRVALGPEDMIATIRRAESKL